jgi:hypothetical protein
MHGLRLRIISVFIFGFCSSFIAFSQPHISSISPTLGQVSPVGSPITITGTGFGASPDTVTVGGVAAVPSSWSDTRVVAPVPSTLLPGFSDVIVTVGGATSNAQSFLVLPAITAVSPPTAAPIGGMVTVTGTSFGDAPGAVTFNGTQAVPSTWSNTSVTFPVPSGATSGSIVVTSNGWDTNGVYYFVSPTISSLSPASGSTGTSLTINGNGFGTAWNFNPITIGGVSVTPTTFSDTAIAVSVPPNVPAGNADVVVTINGVGSSTATFLLTPSITSLSASSGAIGDSITITGTSFGATAGAITFNGLAATPSSWTDTSIVVPVPAGATSGPVLVTVNGAASNGAVFTVNSPAVPVISSLAPSLGPEGTAVTITGTNFGTSPTGASVTFNGINAVVNNWTDTSIAVVVPPGATTGNVVVTLVHGSTSNGVLFGVPPIINGITPARDGLEAPVTISGSKFGISADDAVVTFNGIVAPQVAWSPTQINVTVPDGLASGTAVVQVVVAALQSNTVNFTITDPLMITPTNIGMLVGESRPFQVLDIDGSVLTGVDVQVDNTDILKLDLDSATQNEIITAQTTGTATLHAVLADRRGKAVVTVYPGSSLPVGALRWDVPTLDGFDARVNNYVRARRVNDGDPDFFVNEFGGTARLRAITSDGLQAWIYPDATSPDEGIFISGSVDGGAIALRASGGALFVTKVDSKGNEVWRQPASDLWDIAVSSDGIVFLLNAPFEATASVVGLSEADGTPQFTAFLPSAQNHVFNVVFDTTKNMDVCASGAFDDTNQFPTFDKIAVGSDGALYVPYTLTSETLNAAPCKDGDAVPNENSTMQYSETFAALRVGSDGRSSTTPIDSINFQGTGWAHAISSVAPADATAIPDGTDGILLDVRRSIYAVDDLSTSPTIQVSVGRVSSAGYQEYPLPFSEGGTNDSNILLGESGSFVVAQGGNVGVFDSNGAPLFNYAGTSVRLSGTATGGMIVLQDGNGEKSTETKMVASDGTITPLLRNAGLSLVDHWANNLWIGISDGFSEVSGEPITSAGSDCPRQGCGAMPNSPATPVISNFAPSHITLAAGSYDVTNFQDEMNGTNPSARVLNRFSLRGGNPDLTHNAGPATVGRFLSEVNSSIEAVAFVGHSLETGQSDPDYSIGINFWYPVSGSLASTLYPEPFPFRTITDADFCDLTSGFQNCLFPLQKDASTAQLVFYKNIPARGQSPFLENPVPMGQVIDVVPRQAKIIFIGACAIQPTIFQAPIIPPFLQMWDIHNQTIDLNLNVIPATKGRAMIAPTSQFTDLTAAAKVWIRIVSDMLGDPKRRRPAMNVGDAVNEANTWAQSVGFSAAWAVIGDPTVRLR